MRERRQCDSNPSARAYRRRKRRHASRWAQAGAPAALEQLEAKLLLADTSFPVIFQWFDGSYNTIEERAADIFAAGYGSIYTPPPGRADQGNFSVGYDQYDRFDLGSPGNPTLYGTETGLKQLVNVVHRLGADYYVDYVINHNGYSDLSSVDGNGHSFYDAGGYPGMVITLPQAIDGDFNSAFEWGDINGRLAGLLDIDHATNWQFVRNPVPGFANNIRAGTQEAFGRLANIPDENNRRFYPDQGLQPIIVFDPVTGEQNIHIYPFNNGNPLAGDPTSENATGYIMRNLQWLVQHIGVDGFRIDAAKHIEGFAMDFFDRGVYRTSFRTLLNGQQKHIFSFSEVFDGNQGYLQTFVKKNINPNDPGRIGGNRDVLDFPLFFALRDNLTGNGFQNSWFNVRNATFDLHDDGMHNGSQGVMFTVSHDEGQPFLGNVAAAYMLMHPGNAVIYFNGKEFGDGRNFPKDGRGDALGGVYGDAIPELVKIRNSHGRGNYIERWIEKEIFAYEREASSVVLLSNRLDSGFDSRTIEVNFAPGTKLIELTGNASGSTTDPFNDIPEVVEVFHENGKNKINVRFLRNSSNGQFHGNGYLVYGLPAPQSDGQGLQLTNVAQVMEGDFPEQGGGGSINYQNGTKRLEDIHVITADSFQAKLKTVRVNLLGSIRDVFADGDNALIRIDGGRDVNGNGFVDYTTPGTQSYGFEEFLTKKSPLWNNGSADGEFIQTLDATQLSEGQHFIEVRAFRHRDDGGPAIFSSFKKTIYIDRLKPESGISSFNALGGQNENRRLTVRSLDLTADNVHVFFDLPAALTDAQVISMVGQGSQANQTDRDLFTKDTFALTHGNHVATIVTFEPTGNVNVQRNAGLFTSTIFGAGLGDLNTDSVYNVADVDAFRDVWKSNNTQFNPAADFNGDGLVDDADRLLFGQRLNEVGADQATIDAFNAMTNPDISIDNVQMVEGDDGFTDFIFTVTLSSAHDQAVTVDYATADGSAKGLLVQRVASGLSSPLYVTAPPGDHDRLFIVEQGSSGTARIKILNRNAGAINATPFLTLTGIGTGGERGLLGLTFHPDYQSNGFFYVNFTDSGGTTTIRRYTVSANPDVANAASAQTVLTIAQPFGNHNGGWMSFGPDGYLYIASGDGGDGNDPVNAGQRLDTLLGKILRIDVNTDGFPGDASRNYAIPESNPFANDGDVNTFGEIWAYGLRNPWRDSFDTLTGDLYIGDVGQNAREEIDVLLGNSPGGENYGWRLREGTIATPTGGVGGAKPAGAIDPIYDYTRGTGALQGRSVTGGYVYRGPLAELNGNYFFGDFINSRVWSLRFNGDAPVLHDGTNFTDFIDWTPLLTPNAGTINSIASFGQSPDGHLFIVDYGGEVFQLTNGADYLPASGMLTFDPGETSMQITVRVYGDHITEQAEQFFVNLSNPVNAFILDGQGQATIVDDDAPPVIGSLSDTPDPVERGENVTITATNVTESDDYVVFVDFYRDTNGNGTLEIGTDAFLGRDNFGSDGWSIDVSTAAFASDENRLFAVATDHAGDVSAAATTLVTVNDPPRVVGVFVDSHTWSDSFRDHLSATGQGGRHGFALPLGSGDQLRTLPWIDLRRISIQFDKDVIVSQDDLSILGVNTEDYAALLAAGGFMYDATSFTATWILPQALTVDKLRLVLTGVTNASGTALDGEWTDEVSTQSGDGVAGGNFRFRLNLVPGDANHSGGVQPDDVEQARGTQFSTPGGAAYSIFNDVTGNAIVLASDVVGIRNRLFDFLPALEPGSVGTGSISPGSAPVTGSATTPGEPVPAVSQPPRAVPIAAEEPMRLPLDLFASLFAQAGRASTAGAGDAFDWPSPFREREPSIWLKPRSKFAFLLRSVAGDQVALSEDSAR